MNMEAPSVPSDAGLLAQISARQEPALSTLYHRHRQRVYSLALLLLEEPAHAEACVDTVFLELWQDPRVYQPTRGALPLLLFAAVYQAARPTPLLGLYEREA